jgi:transposase-like protein
MRQANKRIPESAEKTVRDIRRATRRHHSAEEKIRIVLEGLRGEDSSNRASRSSSGTTTIVDITRAWTT